MGFLEGVVGFFWFYVFVFLGITMYTPSMYFSVF